MQASMTCGIPGLAGRKRSADGRQGMQVIRATVLLLGLYYALLSCASASPESEMETKVKAGARSLLEAIQAHDVERILSFVGPGGVIEDNRVVSRDEITAQLHNDNSYLSRSLFAEPTVEEIAACVEKLEGKLYVSPAAFMHAYGDNYEVQVRRIEEFKGQHYGVKIESEGEAQPGCQFELFWLRMQVVDGRVLLTSNFFQ